METGDILWFWDKNLQHPAFAVVAFVHESCFDFFYESRLWPNVSFSFINNSLFYSFSGLLNYKYSRQEIDSDVYSSWEKCRQRFVSANYFGKNEFVEAQKFISNWAGANPVAFNGRRLGGRVAHCWNCKTHLNNQVTCSSCGWMICPACHLCSPYCKHEIKRKVKKEFERYYDYDSSQPSLRELDLTQSDLEPFSWDYFYNPDYDGEDFDDNGAI